MCKVKDAMSELDKLGKMFLDVEGSFVADKEIEFESIPNVWVAGPTGLANKTILFSSCTDSTPDRITGIAFMPAHATLVVHEHKETIETIMVISGELHYQVFKSDNKEVLLKEGSIRSCEKVMVRPRERHILLTTDKDTYMYVTFKRETNGEKSN